METTWGKNMLKHKYIDFICISVFMAAVLVTGLFYFGENLGIKKADAEPEYVHRLFDDSFVHRIDLKIEDWEEFLNTATEEEYKSCDITIDGEQFNHVGLRVKGNNSKSLVKKYGHERYSLKVEFDHYVTDASYYGLDKMSLDSSFQDNSYLKNYVTYDMMRHMEVPSPLCSYTWVTVNGEDWGLFLALEEPEEAFAKRNFGNVYGRLYKPDYKDINDENQDIALKYIDNNVESYENIFRKAKFATTMKDKQRLIRSLKVLAEGENLHTAVDVDEVLRYFTVQVFVVNLDSYLGPTGHNYYLYEEDGKLSMLPWDYNLAYCTYSLGKPEPVNDSRLYVNYPIDTPASGKIMLNRPMFHQLMLQKEYYEQYHNWFSHFVETYFESGYFENKVAMVKDMIAFYVRKDPTAFCSYEEYLTGVKTFQEFCKLRAESVRKQLDGIIPSTIKGQQMDDSQFVDASSVWLPDMGEVEDLKNGVH